MNGNRNDRLSINFVNKTLLENTKSILIVQVDFIFCEIYPGRNTSIFLPKAYELFFVTFLYLNEWTDKNYAYLSSNCATFIQ